MASYLITQFQQVRYSLRNRNVNETPMAAARWPRVVPTPVNETDAMGPTARRNERSVRPQAHHCAGRASHHSQDGAAGLHLPRLCPRRSRAVCGRWSARPGRASGTRWRLLVLSIAGRARRAQPAVGERHVLLSEYLPRALCHAGFRYDNPAAAARLGCASTPPCHAMLRATTRMPRRRVTKPTAKPIYSRPLPKKFSPRLSAKANWRPATSGCAAVSHRRLGLR